MAITKERKGELVSHYSDWLRKSEALFITEYKGMTMKDIDVLRAKVRELGGEFHIVKNTLGMKALEQAGISAQEEFFKGSTAVCFSLRDAAAMAKAIVDFSKTAEALKIKGGYLAKKPMSAAGVKSLADLPPLPVVRAQLLGTIMGPASKLASTLAEPGRSIAAVIKAHTEAAEAALAAKAA